MGKGTETPKELQAAILSELRRDCTRPNRTIAATFGVTYQVVQSIRLSAGLPYATQKLPKDRAVPMTADEYERLESAPNKPYKDMEPPFRYF